jgi:hypothetical protein
MIHMRAGLQTFFQQPWALKVHHPYILGKLSINVIPEVGEPLRQFLIQDMHNGFGMALRYIYAHNLPFMTISFYS